MMLSKQPRTLNSAMLFNSNILVVDDTVLNRELITTYLHSEGYSHIESAENGRDALEKMKSFTPDLMIVDLLMPVMDGFELIRTLRKNEQYSQIPIIVQTAITNNEEKQEAWSSGANDVLSKPIHKLELLSRVKVQLTTAHMFRQLEDYYKTAQRDIRQALDLQRSLLPNEETIKRIEECYHIDIDYIFEPSQFLSGDLWGLIEVDENQLGVWICDYSGKGIQAALNTFRIHTLVQQFKNSAETPPEFLDLVNKRFHQMLSVGQFATFLMGIFDKRTRTFRYVSASAPDPILYFSQNKTFKIADGSGLPIGVSNIALYPERTINLEEGGALILYSDLLWEPGSLPGICLLPEHLPSFVEELQGKSMVPMVKEYLGYLGNIKLHDDLTLIEIRPK